MSTSLRMSGSPAFRTSALAMMLLSATMLAGCATIPVSVNPRYGAWSKELCSLDGQSGSLSRPAKAATT